MPEKDGRTVLDLSFDSSNAQAIFKMTAGGKMPSRAQVKHDSEARSAANAK
jgi:hypothetical protein